MSSQVKQKYSEQTFYMTVARGIYASIEFTDFYSSKMNMRSPYSVLFLKNPAFHTVHFVYVFSPTWRQNYDLRSSLCLTSRASSI